MRVSTNTIIFILSVITGVGLGFIGGPVIILLPWAVVCLAIGVFSNGKKAALVNGAVFGFVVAFTFMISGYTGDAAVITRVFPFAVLGLVGAACAIALSLSGNIVYQHLRRPEKNL